MSSIFTTYVRALISGAETHDPALHRTLWKSLRGALVYEMKKRGLWHSSPRYLGIYGCPSWEEEDALQDLLTNCYIYSFIQRLRGLVEHLEIKAMTNIDGLIFLNIRHFLHDTQRRHDALGFRVFEMARAAVGQAIDAGDLWVLANGPDIRHDTVFGFTSWTDPDEARDQQLAPQVRALVDQSMPGLVTARGAARRDIEARLCLHIVSLGEQVVRAFRFRDLIDPLKHHVRKRWQALMFSDETAVEDAEDDLAAVVRVMPPNPELEEWDSFAKLDRCMEDKLRRTNLPTARRDRLQSLWRLARDHIVQDDPAKRLPDLTIAKILDLPRGAIPQLKTRLRAIFDDCKQALRRPAETSPTFPEGLQAMSRASRPVALHRRAAEAAAEIAQALEALRRRQNEPPRLGEIFLIEETYTFPVRWLVVDESRQPPHRLQVMAIDDHPLLGTSDQAAIDATGCPVSLRCRFRCWLAAADLNPRLRTGELSDEVLAEVRASTSDRDQEADDSHEYQQWLDEVIRPALAALPGGAAQPVTSPLSQWSRRLAVAASIALLVGLGYGSGSLSRQGRIAGLEQALQQSDRTHSELRSLIERRQSELEASRQDLQSSLRDHDELRQQADALSAAGDRALQKVMDLERRLRELQLEDLQLNLPFVHLTGQEPVRGPRDPLVIPSSARRLALILEVTTPDPYPRYRLVIRQRDSETSIWQSDRLLRTGNELSLDLPTSIFATGDYLLRIYGLRSGEANLLHNYALSLSLE